MSTPDAPSAETQLAQLLTPRQNLPLPPSAQEIHAGSETLADDPLAQVLGATNPLLETARPLLKALAEIPDLPFAKNSLDGKSGGDVDLDRLRQTLVRDMHQFQHLCDRAGFRREQVVAARYCLCTALDEAIYKLPSASGNWADNSLLLLFHNETSGGEKFFLLLGHMVQTPREHIQVLEVLYHILSLGFEGRYALMTDGTRQLETIHRRLLAVLCEHTEPVQPELSPHWRGLSGGRMRFMRTVPVWVTACVLGLLLLALYTSRRAELVPQAVALAGQIEELGQVRTPAGAAVVWNNELPLELWFSAQEQQRFGLQVDVPNQTLRIPGNIAFVNGTDIHPTMAQVLDILAVRLKASSRAVQVVGHTDNTRLRTGSRFRDNQHLSQARAETVVGELVRRGMDAQSLKAVGKSDTAPLASNATSEGRARNRRVEITLQTTETPSQQAKLLEVKP